MSLVGNKTNVPISLYDLLIRSVDMKTLLRYLVIFALLLGAIAAYSAGNSTGMFIFVLVGFLLEGGFWLGLFPMKRKHQ